jgi:hypothetical protein
MDEQALKKSLVASFCEFLEEEKDESVKEALKILKESKLNDERFKPSTTLLEILREYHEKASKQTKKSGIFPYNKSFESVTLRSLLNF